MLDIYSKKKSQKLDEKSYQKIFTRYKGKNPYQIYNFQTRNVYLAQDIKINEYNLYNKSVINA